MSSNHPFFEKYCLLATRTMSWDVGGGRRGTGGEKGGTLEGEGRVDLKQTCLPTTAATLPSSPTQHRLPHVPQKWTP